LIEPAVNPSTILLWNAKASTISGIVTTIEAAAMSPHGTSWSPGKEQSPQESSSRQVEVNVSAKRNSFHEK
jgi:hypothetical protein